MKELYFVMFMVLFAGNVVKGQTQTKELVQDSTHVYELYPTENMWTFIKLDTSTGRMWQVHFAVDTDSFRGEEILSFLPLALGSDAKVGRFCLYPTKNMYNFILLDRKDGRSWQVQWSYDYKNRGIIPIRD